MRKFDKFQPLEPFELSVIRFSIFLVLSLLDSRGNWYLFKTPSVSDVAPFLNLTPVLSIKEKNQPQANTSLESLTRLDEQLLRNWVINPKKVYFIWKDKWDNEICEWNLMFQFYSIDQEGRELINIWWFVGYHLSMRNLLVQFIFSSRNWNLFIYETSVRMSSK